MAKINSGIMQKGGQNNIIYLIILLHITIIN